MKWYGGIDLDCDTIPAGATDYYIRTYAGHHLPSPCIPVNGSARGISCRSETYDYGVLASTEGCDRGLGRGSAEVSGAAGCCRLYDNEQCRGAPYVELSEGVCYDEVVVRGFTCVSLFCS